MTPAMRRPRSRDSNLSRCSSDRVFEFTMLHDSSTRLSEVLTCCPPGPDERENRQPSSEAGIVNAVDTSRSIREALHVPAPDESSSEQPKRGITSS